MVCHPCCPQALAEALKVNSTVTNINLFGNHIGKEGAKAWCLGRGSVAPGLETVNENGVKCTKGCTRGVRDFSAVGYLSKRVIEMGWKQAESEMGEGVLTRVKLVKNSNTRIKQYLVLAEIHLDFDS